MSKHFRLWPLAVALFLAIAAVPAQAERGRGGERWAGQHVEKVRWRGGGHGHHRHHRHGGHFRSHLFIGLGFPLFWPWYEPGYISPYPRTVVVPQAPPVYVERADGAGEAAGDFYWYYCTSSGVYYPYVKTCATPWQRVAPQPPSPQ